MESNSGSGSINDTFNCRTSDLNPDAVTDKVFWSLRESVIQGGPAIAFFESLIFCVAVGWNLFIVITYLLKYKLLKEPANIFLFSLAITHILICVMVVPFTIVSAAAGEFLIGNNDIGRCIACSTQGFFYILLTMVSLHLLAMLSIDRCMLLSNPLRYKRYSKVWLAVLGVCSVWVWCFILAILPAFGFGEWEFNRNFGLCLPRWTPDSNLRYTALLIIEALIPIIVLAITHLWTYKIVTRFLKRNLKRQKSFKFTEREIAIEDSKHEKQQTQLVKVFGALFIANIVTWTPTVIIFISFGITGGDNIPDWTYIIGWLTYLTNPMIHPILESFFIKELRTRVNRAKRTVRTSVRNASRSLIKMATLESFKNIPDVPDDEDTPNTKRNLFKKKNTALSISSTSTDVPDSPTHLNTSVLYRSSSLTNSPRKSPKISTNRQSAPPVSPLTKALTSPELHPPTMNTSELNPSPLTLPKISEAAELDTSETEQQHVKFANVNKQTNTDSEVNSSITEKKKRHVSISLPGESTIYHAGNRHTPSPVSPVSLDAPSNDSAIHSDVSTEFVSTPHQEIGLKDIIVQSQSGTESVRTDSGTGDPQNETLDIVYDEEDLV